jgi:hypothetical protein
VVYLILLLTCPALELFFQIHGNNLWYNLNPKANVAANLCLVASL